MIGQGDHYVREVSEGQRLASAVLRTVAIPFWIVGPLGMAVSLVFLLVEVSRPLVPPDLVFMISVACLAMGTVQSVLADFLAGKVPWKTRGSGIPWFLASVSRDVLLLSGLLVILVSTSVVWIQGLSLRGGIALGAGVAVMGGGVIAHRLARRFGESEYPRSFGQQ